MDTAITFYDDAGRLTGTLTGAESVLLESAALSGQGYLSGAHDARTHYAQAGVLTVRPTQATVLTGFTLTDVPVPCTVVIVDAVGGMTRTYPCNDATIDLEFAHAGTYRVTVRAWPYRDKEFTLENPAH